MDRNVEAHFSQFPSTPIQRSIFKLNHGVCLTCNVGDLIPVDFQEVLPGDTFNVTTSKVIRLQTPLRPLMSNLYADFYHFFVPARKVWSHWNEFCGENTQSAWIQPIEYTVPKIKPPAGGFKPGTIADYLGIPVNLDFTAGPNGETDHFPSALPFRSYALVCNEFFRDQNVSDPLVIPDGDAMQEGSNGDNYITDVANGGKPFKVAKFHDYFTSCLPSPQKGPAASVPVTVAGGTYPVIPGLHDINEASVSMVGLQMPASGSLWKYTSSSGNLKYTRTQSVNGIGLTAPPSGTAAQWKTDSPAANASYYFPNMVAEIDSLAGGMNINDIRLAFATQSYLEKLARGGSRYIEIINSMFGVTSSDARLDRPEYLGGNRVPVQIHQVSNTSQGEQDFLGDVGAMSYTADVHSDFEKSFEEHGYILTLMCLRYDHVYSQGLDRAWTRTRFTDFYLPPFANIGEQPILSSEIYCDGNVPDVFGYNEAWCEYRFRNSRTAGEMRPGIPGSLASWHLGDYYNSKPTLSDGWIREDKTIVDRALSVTSAVADQVLADIWFDVTATRPMPMYSIPGSFDRM